MINFLLYLWQLPQHFLAKTIICFVGAKKWEASFDAKDVQYYTMRKRGLGSVSLGQYVLINFAPGPGIIPHMARLSTDVMKSIKHEAGHCRQSKYLGVFYLLVIGLPSMIGNLLHRKFKFDYYKQPWEAWADRLGGVVR